MTTSASRRDQDEVDPNYMVNQAEFNSARHAYTIDWLLNTSQSFVTFKRETFHWSVHYFETYLSKVNDVPKDYIQLVALTCLYLAHKIEEPKHYWLKYFLEGTKREYSIDDVYSME